ncbi:MAG: PAS domain-containing protein [Gammaproteobacteria bacterium]|nr:PAS domain-containing protein [Gammaproteobacteria bacterium]
MALKRALSQLSLAVRTGAVAADACEVAQLTASARESPEPFFAVLARLALAMCEAQHAVISIPESGIACCCTATGALPPDQVPACDPFLPYLAREQGVLAIPDLLHDLRFAQDECVTGPLAARCYAGIALRTADARVRGMLAVYGSAARRLSPRQAEGLVLLAQQAVTLLEIGARLAEQETLYRNTLAHRALLETLIAHLPLALVACDAEGRVTHFNREAAEMCSIQRNAAASGTADEYTVGAAIYQADGVTPVERSEQPLGRTLRGEQVENLELVVVPRDSTERVTLSNGRRLLCPDGRPVGAVVVTQDITERRRSELELERVHEQLRASARQAGMTEVATSILHNVGNVLTSINVSATLVAEGLKRSQAEDVCQVAALLQAQGPRIGEFMMHDDRGKLVPGYLQALGEQLVKDTESAVEHMAGLRKSLEHVNNAVAMQQNFAKLTSVRETVSAVDLVEDSLRLSAGAFSRHGVELRREFEPTPPMTVDKHKVLQILVNLISNAKHACDDSGKKEKVVTLRIEGDGALIRISVIDNGVGIAPENMGRLFTHGFTTRPSGHGFGLHSGAIAARQLGGSLRAASPGPGEGATFVLELPRESPETAP